MLSYKITSSQSKNTSKPLGRKTLTLKDPDYKEQVLKRITSNLQYIKGQKAKIKGSRRFGIITKIYFNHNEIEYDAQGRPLFIEFLPDDGHNPVMLGIHQITRKGVK